MDKYNLTVLAEAKQEYTKQLVNILYSEMYVGLKSIYDAALTFCDKNKDKNVLKKFQELLSYIPKWNTDRINNEYKRIVRASDCEWIEDLITAVFVSHTKVLTSIKVKNKTKKALELNVPNGPYFLHKCYVEAARNFWKKPFLLYHNFPNIELQRNLSDSENLIKESIEETIRKQLPVKHILQEYLGGDYRDEDAEEDVTSHVSTNTKENLRKLVKAEIEQTLYSKTGNNDDTHSVVKIESDESGDLNDKNEQIGGNDNTDNLDKTSEFHKDVVENFSNTIDTKSIINDKDSEFVLNEIKQSIKESNVDLSNIDFNLDNKTVALETKDALSNSESPIEDGIKRIEIQTNKKYTNIGGSSNNITMDVKPVQSDIKSHASIVEQKSVAADLRSTMSSKMPLQTKLEEPKLIEKQVSKEDEFSFFHDAAPF